MFRAVQIIQSEVENILKTPQLPSLLKSKCQYVIFENVLRFSYLFTQYWEGTQALEHARHEFHHLNHKSCSEPEKYSCRACWLEMWTFLCNNSKASKSLRYHKLNSHEIIYHVTLQSKMQSILVKTCWVFFLVDSLHLQIKCLSGKVPSLQQAMPVPPSSIWPIIEQSLYELGDEVKK
jgi:hypothetical protein